MAGRDIKAQEGDYVIAIRKVRNWIYDLGEFEKIGAAMVTNDYDLFRAWNYNELISCCRFSRDDIADYGNKELLDMMTLWMPLNH